MNERLIKQAIDENLSSLNVSIQDKNTIMDKITERKTTSPKFSVALVICMVTLLVAIGALAAVLLGGKDFTQTVVSPIASQSDSDVFTPEEIDRILRFAADNNITLDQEWMDTLNRGEGYYKEELMRALVKTELGFYPGQWSLEDQNWYDQMLVDCGLKDRVSSLVPGEGDFTQDEVIQMALDAFAQGLAVESDLTDTSNYTRWMTLSLYQDSPYRKMKIWSVDYEELNSDKTYSFSMLDNGLITNLQVYGSSTKIYESALSRAGLAKEFKQVFGENPIDWSMEELEALHNAVTLAEGENIADEGMRAISETHYVIPGLIYTYLDEEEVKQTARTACGADESLTPYVIYIGDDPSNMHWKISFRDRDNQFVSYAEIDGKRGEVEWEGTYENKPWYAPLVLDDQLPIYVPKSTETKKRDQPTSWRDPMLSDSYWDTLEALGCNYDTLETLTAQWNAEYGEFNWPTECDVAYWWWDAEDQDIVNNRYDIPGLVDETDMTWEAATEIAISAFQKSATGTFTQEQLDNTKGAGPGTFYFAGTQYRQHKWLLNLITDLGHDKTHTCIVEIDAKTGEVLRMDIDLVGSNG